MTRFETALHHNLQLFAKCLPSVRDGDTEAIHDARVATRRLRAILPIARQDWPAHEMTHALRLLRNVGRLLGRARDVDVVLEQIATVERRLPSAAAALAGLRADLLVRQARERQRIAAGLNKLSAGELLRPESLTGPTPLLPRRSAAHGAIARQAELVNQAADAAGGVYMPEPAHALRIELKKLRYLLEPMSGSAGSSKMLKVLRRAQELLGAIHDKQSLVDRVRRASGRKAERRAILALVEEECRELFAVYVEQREDVRRVCDALSRASRSRDTAASRGVRVAALAGMLAPPALWLIRRGRRASLRLPGQAVAVQRHVKDAIEPMRPVEALRSEELALRR